MAEKEGMLCPVCGVGLVMSERQNIEIDYCPKCRGVWLDRGELDKIIERSAADAPAARPPQTPAGAQPGQFGHGGHGGHYKKRKSWLSELFD